MKRRKSKSRRFSAATSPQPLTRLLSGPQKVRRMSSRFLGLPSEPRRFIVVTRQPSRRSLGYVSASYSRRLQAQAMREYMRSPLQEPGLKYRPFIESAPVRRIMPSLDRHNGQVTPRPLGRLMPRGIRHVGVCVRRKIRREVIHALGLAGKGRGSGKKSYSLNSQVEC